MPDIFISYRRDDAAGWAGRLSRELKEDLTGYSVFMDIDSIEPGLDYEEVIDVQPQAGDADQAAPDERREEVQGGEAAVAHQHDLAPGQPAARLESHLPRPVGQLLVAPAVLAAVPLRRGQSGEERQGPDPARPGDRGQEHQAEPAQAAGLDEVALRGTDRVAVDAFGADPLAAAALDRLVDAQHHGTGRREGVEQ